MYYYLLYNSSFSFIVENRLFSTILYGSILYILTHAILNYCDVSILAIINNYFWTTLTLDVISFTYAIYNSFMNDDFSNGNSSSNSSDNNNSNNSNSLNVSFNLLKNKINTMLDRKNDLTITHIPNTNQLQDNNKNNNKNQINTNPSQKNNKVQIQENFNNITTYDNSSSINNTNVSIDDFDFTDLDDVIQPPTSQPLSQFSTPIKHLQTQKNNSNTNTNNSNNNTNTNTNSTMLKASTPISLIRNNTKISEPIIQDDSGLGNESVAGSDVGSIMDLEDFENSF
jgi:hypothetical protein